MTQEIQAGRAIPSLCVCGRKSRGGVIPPHNVLSIRIGRRAPASYSIIPPAPLPPTGSAAGDPHGTRVENPNVVA
ncbi:MAG: hypothetical protein MZV64_17400 [Ignavibacteriales bacterium]|nr:hypothetical protein [Ignavibacteriales bacterium]